MGAEYTNEHVRIDLYILAAEDLGPAIELFHHRFLHALREGKPISPGRPADLVSWKHSGFNIHDGGEKPVPSHDCSSRVRLRSSTFSSVLQAGLMLGIHICVPLARQLTDLWRPFAVVPQSSRLPSLFFFPARARPAPSFDLLFSSRQSLSFRWKPPRLPALRRQAAPPPHAAHAARWPGFFPALLPVPTLDQQMVEVRFLTVFALFAAKPLTVFFRTPNAARAPGRGREAARCP